MNWTSQEARWVEVFEPLHALNLVRHENLATASQYWMMYEKVLQRVPAGSRVLDWGCGDGHFTFFLLHHGYRVEAFNVNAGDEYHPEGCRIAPELKERFGDAYHYTESEDDPVGLPYETGTFDAATSVGVLEHVRQEGGDEVLSLREIGRVLRPGGRFLCFHFPNRFSWIEAVARRIPSKHSHPYRFTRRDIRALVRRAGLVLDESGSYAVLPRNELARLPESVKNRPGFVKGYNAVDRALEKILRPIVQNHFFIARKPGDGEASS